MWHISPKEHARECWSKQRFFINLQLMMNFLSNQLKKISEEKFSKEKKKPY